MSETEDRATLTGFVASGILGSRSYRLDFGQTASIIVGPNGTGKSTFLLLLYLFISRQWQRLNEFEFNSLTLLHTNGEITLTKADLLTFDSLSSKRGGMNERMASKLLEQGAMDLMYKASLTAEEREKVSLITGLPVKDVTAYRRYFQTEFGFSRKAFEVDREVSALGLGEVIYLPTYRRIEKDIKSIFPDIENRLRSRIEDSHVAPRTGSGFKEIAGFGMADIQRMVDNYTSDIRDYRRQASETASQEYIRDIVTGKIKKYSLSNLRKMPDADFEDFKNSLDDKLFSDSDRKSLRLRIDELRARQTGQPTAESRFLGMFVEKLLAAHTQVKARERPLRAFINTVSSYLKPEKKVILRGHEMAIVAIENEEIVVPFDKLSSGEKQIVSIFAYLLLSGQNNFIVLIDEPELSLSVAWQKRFFPDLIETESCAHVVSVTHSPFVFDNYLRENVVDVRRLRFVSDE